MNVLTMLAMALLPFPTYAHSSNFQTIDCTLNSYFEDQSHSEQGTFTMIFDHSSGDAFHFATRLQTKLSLSVVEDIDLKNTYLISIGREVTTDNYDFMAAGSFRFDGQSHYVVVKQETKVFALVCQSKVS